MRKLLALLLAGGAGLAVLLLWPRSSQDPEEQIRALVAGCVKGVEKRDLGPLSDALAPDFRGPEGVGAQEVKQLVLGQAMRNQEMVAVFNPSLDVTLHSESTAEFSGVFLFARSKELTPETTGSAYRIGAKLERRDKEWKIVSATYAPMSWP